MKKQIVIQGAGITGLSLSYFLKKRFKETIDITIVEKSNRAGGWVETIREGAFQFEKGPRTIRVHETTLNLIEELGLKDDLLFSTNKARYLLKEDKLEELGFFSPILKGKKRALIKGLLKWGSKKEDESVHSFATRRFSESVANDLFAPMALGIYAGDIKTLSLKHCFPGLYALDQRPLPFLLSLLLKKKSGKTLFALKNGLDSLTNQLAAKATILYETTELPPYDHLFSTIPHNLVPYQSLHLVHLGWHGKQLPISGFGYLVPKGSILGVVFDSEIFDDPSTTRLTVMMKENNLEKALDHVQKVLNISKKPDFYQQSLAKDAIPQYPLGFDQILDRLYEKKEKITYLGSSYTGVSINDCIQAASRCASRFSLLG